MRKSFKIAFILVIIRLIVFLAVFILNGFNFGKIFNKNYETKTYDVTDGFSDVLISIDEADVILVDKEGP